jgi:hypothetical protein
MMTLVKSESCEPRCESARKFIACSERRRGLRIRQARPVKLFEGCGSQYFGGQTEDISATGLRVELPMSARLERGTIVSIHVGLTRQGSSLANRKQLMAAKVVWLERDAARGYAVAGIEFLSSISAHLDAA